MSTAAGVGAGEDGARALLAQHVVARAEARVAETRAPAAECDGVEHVAAARSELEHARKGLRAQLVAGGTRSEARVARRRRSGEADRRHEERAVVLARE